MAILQNTTVSGSLVVTGDLTARQFILSSSVTFYTESFSSGSTRFGDSMDDTMVVTGSLRLTGSMGIGAITPTNLLTIKNNSGATNGIDFQNYSTSGVLGQIVYSQSDDSFNIVNTSAFAAGGIVLKTNSTEKVRILTNGNVGIGTTSPVQPLQLGQVSVISQDANSMYIGANFGSSTGGNYIKSQYANQIHFDSATGVINFKVAGSGTAGNAISYTTGMSIQSDGRILNGTDTSTPTTSFRFRYNASGSNDVMAIVVAGALANNTSYIAFRTGTGEGSYKADIRYETGALSLNNMSDFRFKENIVDAPSQWNKVKNSKLRIFDWKDKTANNQLGFIAQELYQTIPEAVGKGGDEEQYDGNEKKIWTIAETKLVPAMFGALQEAMAKIEELTARIEALENK